VLNKAKRKVLKRVRVLIHSGRKKFICHAIEEVQAAATSAATDKACRELRRYVRASLDGHSTLSCWQRGNGISSRYTTEQLRADRLAWIDWMLDEPKPLHDETYCLAA
jgi:hypothetical protein